MEIGDETSEEIVRYAFLLGSALRNEDSRQFFQIYDAIIPKDLPVEKVNLAYFQLGIGHRPTTSSAPCHDDIHIDDSHHKLAQEMYRTFHANAL